MTTAQEILTEQDILLAIQKKRATTKEEAIQIQNKIVSSFNNAFTPPPRATNRVDFAINLAKNAFSIWQGINMGLKIVKGFKAAFKR